MDKQIIKNIIIEKQVAIPNYKLIHRDFLFGDKSNYILVGLRRAGKSYLLYQDIQTRLQKENSRHKISSTSTLRMSACHPSRQKNWALSWIPTWNYTQANSPSSILTRFRMWKVGRNLPVAWQIPNIA